MKKPGTKLLASIFIIVIFFSKGFSQDGNPLQFLSNVSQSAQFNPAIQNKSEKLVVGLPFISGIDFDWKSNFSPDYIFYQNFNYSFNRFFTELGKPGDAISSVSFPFIYLSLRQDQHNFSFSVREKVLAETVFNHEVLQFIDRGLIDYYGNDANFGPINFKSFYYREFAVGYSNQVWDGLTIGIRPKLLSANFYYNVTDLNYSLQTDEVAQQLLLTPTGSYTISGPIDVNYIEDVNYTEIRPNPRPADYIFNFKNLSPALDIGINYRSEQGFEISASVIDIGYINFKDNNYDVDFVEPIQYDREDLYQSNNPDALNYKEPKVALQELTDSIPYIISATPFNQRIKQEIPTKINLSLKQQITKQTEVGLSGQLKFYEDRSEQYITGLIHQQFSPKFEIAGTISLLNFDKILPGIGLSYTGRWVQYYLSANNITSLLKPSSAKYLNLSIGVNFLFSTIEK